MVSFSAGVSQLVEVFQSMTGSGDMAAGENRVLTSVMVDDDGVY
jgi:hypothetical protein